MTLEKKRIEIESKSSSSVKEREDIQKEIRTSKEI